MFKSLFWSRNNRLLQPKTGVRRPASFGLEDLEGRQLLSAPPMCGHQGGAMGFSLNAIEFSQAPADVQTGLDKLAEGAGLADPADTQKVLLGNFNGIESYTVVLSDTGTVTRLTVDQDGNAIAAPTTSASTWEVLSGTDTGSNAAAAAEITVIATALNLTVPTATTTVNVTTTSAGGTIYSVTLSPVTSTTTTISVNKASARATRPAPAVTISVDATGNPVGNQVLPFSVIPAAIQAALNAHVPSGSTALAADSTQSVNVQTFDGVTLYSLTFTSTGIRTTITVNASGVLTSLPAHSSTTFGVLTTAAQTELQTLATANGVTDTIVATQKVDAFTEANGTTLYSVTLTTTTTDSNGNTRTGSITITVDANGNPTVLPASGPTGPAALPPAGPGKPGGPPAGGPGRGDCDKGNSSSTATTTTTSAAKVVTAVVKTAATTARTATAIATAKAATTAVAKLAKKK